MSLTNSRIYSSETGATTWRALFALFGLGWLCSQASAFQRASDCRQASALKRIAGVWRPLLCELRRKREQHHLPSLVKFHAPIALRSVGSAVGFATKQLGETHESKFVLGKNY
jgi:hypothetical protein